MAIHFICINFSEYFNAFKTLNKFRDYLNSKVLDLFEYCNFGLGYFSIRDYLKDSTK